MRPRILFAILTGIGLALGIVVAMVAQTGNPPAAISAYIRLANQIAAPYLYKWLVIDPPLVLTIDSAGTPHLGDGYVPPAPGVRNEVPAAGATAGLWTLARAPSAIGAACYRNGVRQQPGVDYTIAGGVISSGFWQATDALLCDYN